jgi:hypothetical protein
LNRRIKRKKPKLEEEGIFIFSQKLISSEAKDRLGSIKL